VDLESVAALRTAEGRGLLDALPPYDEVAAIGLAARLRADHDALIKEWGRIQQDPAYTEYLIRKNLGYVKKGEVEYQILKKEK